MRPAPSPTNQGSGLIEHLTTVLAIAILALLMIKAFGWRLQEPTLDAAVRVEFPND